MIFIYKAIYKCKSDRAKNNGFHLEILKLKSGKSQQIVFVQACAEYWGSDELPCDDPVVYVEWRYEKTPYVCII